MTRRLVRRMTGDRGGASAIEFAFLLPVLLIVMTASVTLYLLFRDSKIAEKSTFTVADIVSRRTSVDQAFLLSSYNLFLRMSNRKAADVHFRVSSIVKQSGTFSVAWSYAVAPEVTLTSANIPLTKLPLVSDGDSLVLVETLVDPSPLEAFIPIEIDDYANFEFVRPRFTSAISKTD